jgi:glycogen debranching enzyme
MDAVVGGRAVTPRVGKPVEVQALWINALKIAGSASGSWGDLRDRALASFRERFWSEDSGALYDVVDCDHVPGRDDATFRPNQVLAVGGLPFAVLSGRRAVAVVESVQDRLLTPLGLRSLAPEDPRYVGRYRGGADARDGAYHQGTVWPWLLGPFAEAWVRVRGGGGRARREARRLFLEPLLARVGEPGLGHFPELADGDEPHRPGGCPFQAWSVGEALRLDRDVLAEARSGSGRREPGGGRRTKDRDLGPAGI